MKRTKYTKGFEKFWKAWGEVTGKIYQGKAEAFKYWKRDKLEGDEDELIRILKLQDAERERVKKLGEWMPEWCFAQKWLNKHRYEYIPEPPQSKRPLIFQKPKEEAPPIKKLSEEERKKLRDKFLKTVQTNKDKLKKTTMTDAQFAQKKAELIAKLGQN